MKREVPAFVGVGSMDLYTFGFHCQYFVHFFCKVGQKLTVFMVGKW